MPGYHPSDFEKKWQAHWLNHKTFRAANPGQPGADRPKYYVLDMFPYPSGAGLHVGHPLGYIASDIVARYKRHMGYNVLHPMGFDSFGLPAEQYAIQTGQHPENTTRDNIARYTEQLQSLGFSYDWDREVRTSNADYYRWTQWIFLQLFNSWYDLDANRARSLKELTDAFGAGGSAAVRAAGDDADRAVFTAGQWQMFTEHQRLETVAPYRLAYQTETYVNWCPALGTVLSNDEVKDGVSERGGYPVERRLMAQWMLRITAFADRLLRGLDQLDWPDAVKEMQRNWIGRSEGAEVRFALEYRPTDALTVFTTRPDTLFGVSYLAVAPEFDGLDALCTDEYRDAVAQYVYAAKNRSERDRQADVKTISGQFTGAYATHPFTGARVPVWVADYVLAGYGTGVVMAVPAHDTRDYAFARHFELPIVPVIEGYDSALNEAYTEKSGRVFNSGFLDGLEVKHAITAAIAELEKTGQGAGRINFRLRDAIFGRQRYWGEPLPIYYAADGTARGIAEKDLPLTLPEIDEYKPTQDGNPPLGRATDWKYEKNGAHFPFELSTMPGWAGSSWYYLRYMDPSNPNRFVSEEAEKYWGEVDFYLGGAEHATGHLLYSRFWYLFLKDLGLVTGEEPFRKLLNQGMILGRSSIVYRVNVMWGLGLDSIDNSIARSLFISRDFKERLVKGGMESLEGKRIIGFLEHEQVRLETEEFSEQSVELIHAIDVSTDISEIKVDVSRVDNDVLDINGIRQWRDEFNNAEFLLEPDGRFLCGAEVEKMSKSKHNVVTPDDLVEKSGADALRCYEMFLGPLEQYKPWNTSGLSGVSTFLRRFWRLFHPEDGDFALTEEAATPAELKILHGTIKKVRDDVERLSFNTVVSALMIATNELSALNCHKRAVLAPLVIVLEPYAPHLAEELWAKLGHAPGTVSTAPWPAVEEKYLVADEVTYPLAVNGKVRSEMVFAATATAPEIEEVVRASDFLAKYAEGKAAKKIIVVPGRMVNVVV